MKTILKKMNRGILIFIVLLLGVTVYLTALALVQNREKPVLEAVCRDYIAWEIQYRQLPEAYRTPEAEMSDAEFADYLTAMEQGITDFYPQDGRAGSLAADRLATHLEFQREDPLPILHFEKTVSQVESFVFAGSRVTVTLSTQSVVERSQSPIDPNMGGRIAGEVEDVIVLEKVDGEWKVIHAAIEEPWRQQRY